MSSIPASAGDRNVALLHESEKLEKLTFAVDALVARHYVLSEKEDVLDELERYVKALEAEVDATERSTADIRARCALLRPDQRRATVGEDAEVMALWRAYGTTMAALLAKHSARLVGIEEAMAEKAAAEEDAATSLVALPPT